MKKLFQYFIAQRWHLHSIALPINFIFFYLGNQYNFMHLRFARWTGIVGTEYFFQAFLSLFGTFAVAFVWELSQMSKGANKTKLEWKLFAKPDIVFTTTVGFLGFLLEIVIFELNRILTLI